MNHINNILIVGGLHGDEPSGIEVAKYFRKNTYSHIHSIIGNPEAIKQNIRFVGTDMNRSFQAKTYISIEEKRAKEIKKLLYKYDLIIDIHNTRAPHTTCAITTCTPNNLHILLANYFCFSKIVIMPPSGSLIAQNPDKAISLEIALDDTEKFSKEYLIKKLINLQEYLPSSKKKKLAIYKYGNTYKSSYLNKMGFDITNLTNFKDISKKQKIILKLPINNHYYPIFFKPDKKEDTISFIT